MGQLREGPASPGSQVAQGDSWRRSRTILPAFVKHLLFGKAIMVSAASLIYGSTGVPQAVGSRKQELAGETSVVAWL